MITTVAHTLFQSISHLWPRQATITAVPAPTPMPPGRVQQLHLLPGQVMHLAPGEYKLYIQQGRIWVDQVGREQLLYSGETLWVGRHQPLTTFWATGQQAAAVALQQQN